MLVSERVKTSKTKSPSTNPKPYECFLKWWYPQNTSKWSFLVGKPMGLLGKPTILGNPHIITQPPRALLLHFTTGPQRFNDRWPVANPENPWGRNLCWPKNQGWFRVGKLVGKYIPIPRDPMAIDGYWLDGFLFRTKLRVIFSHFHPRVTWQVWSTVPGEPNFSPQFHPFFGGSWNWGAPCPVAFIRLSGEQFFHSSAKPTDPPFFQRKTVDIRMIKKRNMWITVWFHFQFWFFSMLSFT